MGYVASLTSVRTSLLVAAIAGAIGLLVTHRAVLTAGSGMGETGARSGAPLLASTLRIGRSRWTNPKAPQAMQVAASRSPFDALRPDRRRLAWRAGARLWKVAGDAGSGVCLDRPIKYLACNVRCHDLIMAISARAPFLPAVSIMCGRRTDIVAVGRPALAPSASEYSDANDQ